jgi:hypothetical protein
MGVDMDFLGMRDGSAVPVRSSTAARIGVVRYLDKMTLRHAREVAETPKKPKDEEE